MIDVQKRFTTVMIYIHLLNRWVRCRVQEVRMEGPSDLLPHILPPAPEPFRLQDPPICKTPPVLMPPSPTSIEIEPPPLLNLSNFPPPYPPSPTVCLPPHQTPGNTPATPLTPGEPLASQASVDSGVTSTLSFDMSHNSSSAEALARRRRVRRYLSLSEFSIFASLAHYLLSTFR